jgi:lysophospholipid acyltransferase (LPLAT)-like uncharacterized protein
MARQRSRLSRLRRRITRSNVFVAFLAALATLVIRAYAHTLRLTIDVHPEAEARRHSRTLYAFWHGRQFLLAPSFRDWNIALMTDLSWAGSIQAGIMARLGYRVIRGSSRRRPARALAEVANAMESGYSAAFAVDGPHGPIHRSKPGILYLAGRFGCPIVPVATSARPSWRVGSTTGGLTTEELDSALMKLTKETDRKLGLEPPPGGRGPE